jgi:hypothetical protein
VLASQVREAGEALACDLPARATIIKQIAMAADLNGNLLQQFFIIALAVWHELRSAACIAMRWNSLAQH